MQFKRHRLENGLEVIAEITADALSTSIGFFVNTGSRDETPEMSGMSHFLEHMVFKGSATRDVDAVNREFEAMGAAINACTGEEHTVYYSTVLPECAEKAIEIWADILRPSLRDEDFVTEKDVILEEIQIYLDMPPFGADQKSLQSFFGSHPLGNLVAGTKETVSAMTARMMRDYHRNHYGSNRIVLAVCGNIDFNKLIEWADRYCGSWQPATDREKSAPATPCRGFDSIVRPSAVQQYSMLLSSAPLAGDSLRYAAKLLAVIIGDETGSRFFWEFVDPGLAEHASITHYEFEDAALYWSYLCCEPDEAESNLERLRRLFANVTDDGVTEAELDQAKSKILSRVVLGAERPRDRLFGFGSEWTAFRRYDSIEDDLSAVRAVTLDEVNRVLTDFPLDKNLTVTIGPKKF